MSYQTIDEIYVANNQIRTLFAETVMGIFPAELNALPDGEKWSIKEIVEHVSIVDEGMAKICRKLLSEAQRNEMRSTGEIMISDVFRAYTDNVDDMKLEAPERVWPTGERSVEESQRKIDENQIMFESLRTLFREFNGTSLKFLHPYFGPLSAQDWLVLSGEHMRRHTNQIQKVVEKIRQ